MTGRVVEPEVMDDPSLDEVRHRGALHGLARLNRIGRSATIVWNAIRDLLSTRRTLRVLDLATGCGDVPIALARRAAAAGVRMEIAGCDISDVAIDDARRRAADARADVAFFRLDAIAQPLPIGFDVVVCSLFLHHLGDESPRRLLQKMGEAAARRVVVSDLRRSRSNLVLVWLASRVVTSSRIVHVDGPRSVRAAFDVHEARRLAEAAGLRGAEIVPRFPCRWLLTWDKR